MYAIRRPHLSMPGAPHRNTGAAPQEIAMPNNNSK
jgi:hypothetical protein